MADNTCLHLPFTWVTGVGRAGSWSGTTDAHSHSSGSGIHCSCSEGEHRHLMECLVAAVAEAALGEHEAVALCPANTACSRDT